jgi:hypothetical protein
MLDVLMLTFSDWANTGWRFSQCLRGLGLNVLFLKANMHSYLYPEQGIIHPALAGKRHELVITKVPELKQYADVSTVIHYIASAVIDTTADLTKKKVVLQHGGKTYRLNHEGINRDMNPYVDATIVQMPNLLGLGAKNEVYISFPVDTNFIYPVFEMQRKKPIFGFFPSLPKEKGVETIFKIVKKLDKDPETSNKFYYTGAFDSSFRSTSATMWHINLQRVAICDVIIDNHDQRIQSGIDCAEWGNAAVEAAALGKIVITSSRQLDVYEKEYCKCPLRIANDSKTFERHMRELISMSGKELREEKERNRAWVEKYHSFPATGKRLWDKVYKDLLG